MGIVILNRRQLININSFIIDSVCDNIEEKNLQFTTRLQNSVHYFKYMGNTVRNFYLILITLLHMFHTTLRKLILILYTYNYMIEYLNLIILSKTNDKFILGRALKFLRKMREKFSLFYLF